MGKVIQFPLDRVGKVSYKLSWMKADEFFTMTFTDFHSAESFVLKSLKGEQVCTNKEGIHYDLPDGAATLKTVRQ